MALTECAKGHLYNTDQYAACPYCNNLGNRIDFGENKNAAPEYYRSGMEAPKANKTVAPELYRNEMEAPKVNKTVAPEFYRNGIEPPKVSKTVAPEAYRDEIARARKNVTVGTLEKIMHIDPVVGWIVCIEGSEKGRDFQIKARSNTIGRSEDMDICLRGDTTIFRKNHARLSYDVKHNDFYIIPAENANNIYLNDQPVYTPAKLSSYDLIELGESKFLFVPFCNDKFKWENGNR